MKILEEREVGSIGFREQSVYLKVINGNTHDVNCEDYHTNIVNGISADGTGPKPTRIKTTTGFFGIKTGNRLCKNVRRKSS